MPEIRLLFTCPHGGKNDDGSTTDPPIIELAVIFLTIFVQQPKDKDLMM
jgi:hypothetical protein